MQLLKVKICKSLKKLWRWKLIQNAKNSSSSNIKRFSALFSWIIIKFMCMTNYNLSNKTLFFDKLIFSVLKSAKTISFGWRRRLNKQLFGTGTKFARRFVHLNMWSYLFSSRCVRILLGSYHMPDSVIGTACVLWPDSAVEHVGGLCRYFDRKSCVQIGAFNLIHTTCIRYISCICIYLGNFVFVFGCFFVYLFYCWIFSMFLPLLNVSFYLY